jgi:hypothetical protein
LRKVDITEVLLLFAFPADLTGAGEKGSGKKERIPKTGEIGVCGRPGREELGRPS